MEPVSPITSVWYPEPLPPDGSLGRMALAPHVILLEVLDGTSRLLDLSGQFYGMSPISTAMLTATLRDGPHEAVRRIAEEYDTPAERVRADLDRFLRDLKERGLVLPGAQARRGRSAADLLAGAALGSGRMIRRALRPWPTAWAWALLTLLRLCLWGLGWARTVDVVRALGDPCPDDPRGEWADDVARVDRLVRRIAAGHILLLECKERALGCWALLRSAGWPAELVVGVDLFPFLGHCWCESGRWTVGDDRERCERFVPVIRYA
jgi:hypothetical protein